MLSDMEAMQRQQCTSGRGKDKQGPKEANWGKEGETGGGGGNEG